MDLYALDKDFERLIKQFPEARRSLVDRAGDKMFSKVIKNIRTSVDKKTGNLLDGVEMHIGSGGGYSAVKPNWKVAPHTHLIENGHKIVRNGKVCGWVNGKHMYRNALNELADELEKDAEKMINGLVGDIFG